MIRLTYDQWLARVSMLYAYDECHSLPIEPFFNYEHHWNMARIFMFNVDCLKEHMDPREVDIYYLEEHPEVVLRLQEEVYLNAPEEYKHFLESLNVWNELVQKVS